MKGLKTGGRQKGTRNRTSEDIRKSLLKLLDKNLKTLQADIEGLRGKDRVSLLINLARHVIPPALNADKLSDEQLQQVIDYLKSKENSI
jgi:hypothetical protein